MPHDSPGTDGPPSPGRLDREGFALRFQESAKVLWTVAAAVLGDRSHAEDVLQEACVIGLSKLERFDPTTSFAAWMSAIVRNVARNTARKGQRQATSAVAPDLLSELLDQEVGTAGGLRTGPTAEPAIIDRRGELLGDTGDFGDELRQGLLGLRPVARAALLLRSIQGLEYREIAEVLDIPEGTAMSHVHRSRQVLRDRLTADLAPNLAAGEHRHDPRDQQERRAQ